MPQVANTHATYDSKRGREQLKDQIWNVSVSDTPFVKLIGKESVEGINPQWLIDEYAPGATNKVEQGNQSTIAAVVSATRLSNYTQISEKVFGVTGTQEKIEKAGGKSEYNYQLAKKMVELKKDIEFGSLQNATAIAPAGGTAPQARGLFGFMNANTSRGAGGADANPVTNTAAVDGTARAFTETQLKTVLQSMFDNGADLDNSYILLPSTQRTVFDTFLAGQTRFDKAEDKTLTATLEVYIGPFGRVKAVNARHMRQREVAVINPEFLALGMLRAMNDEPLAKIGDTRNVLVNAEWTLINKNPKAHGAICDLT
ncbi:MAG: DUF5309 family protein [Pseudomonadota bacterium]